MKKRVDKKKNVQNILIASGILVLFVALLGTYYFVYQPKECKDANCFQDAKEKCKRVYWIREDTQSSWGYTILGGNNGDCSIQVQLIESKDGSLDTVKLQTKEMICKVSKGDTLAPEKDLSQCSGELKEGIQEIMIQRMHNYILENLGDIKEEFI